MDLDYSIEAIAAELGGASIEGDARPIIKGFAALADAGPEQLSFLASLKYRADLQQSRAGAVLVPQALEMNPAEGQVFIRVKDPSEALATLCEAVESRMRPRPAPSVHPTAVIDPSAEVDPSASIGAFCSVGPSARIDAHAVLESHVSVGRAARIGEGTYIHPRAVVHDYCVLGKRVRLQPGVVIGGDGFGYLQVGRPPELYHRKVPQIGIVVVEDDVEIGANSTVDRARFGETRIGQGTKIDNLVQVAHNVRIGRHCIICAQVGISGSTTIGDYVVLWGQVGVAGHLSIGDGAFVGAQAGVAKSIPAGGKVTGTPARPLIEQRRAEAAMQRLPEFMRKVDSRADIKVGSQD